MGFVAGYGMSCMSWTQLIYICEVGENIEVLQVELFGFSNIKQIQFSDSNELFKFTNF